MTGELDCRGLSCPQPVINTKKALEEAGAPIRVIVDNANAVENVKRFAKSQGYHVESRPQGSDFVIEIGGQKEKAAPEGKSERYVVFITTEFLGTGDDRLGAILMKAFLNTLWEAENKPTKILFINSGVKLACEDSEVLDSLKLLSDAGVEIVACGTCLAFYEIKDRLRIGHAGNMYEIVENLTGPGKIIKI